jgi:peptidoglycan LD-endopeptidase LytH
MRRSTLIALALVIALGVSVASFTPLVPLIRWHGPPDHAVVPVAGLPLDRIRSSWGRPRSGHRTHEGADLFAPRRTPVLAATDSVVWRIGANPLGGTTVWTIGAEAALYYYAHLDGFAQGLHAGQALRAGDVIGYVGTTGDAQGTEPHLHFGIYPLSHAFNAVDPVPLLRIWNAGLSR